MIEMEKEPDVKTFPFEITMVLKTLSDENRQRIVNILRTSEKLSFSEISKLSGIDKDLLSFHLKDLMKSLVVNHFYEHKISPKYSFYQLSPFGKSILDALDKVMNPEPVIAQPYLHIVSQQSNQGFNASLGKSIKVSASDNQVIST